MTGETGAAVFFMKLKLFYEEIYVLDITIVVSFSTAQWQECPI